MKTRSPLSLWIVAGLLTPLVIIGGLLGALSSGDNALERVPVALVNNDELIRERYRGIRPAPGYPACPDHRTKRLIFELLHAEQELDVLLTESLAITPTAAVAGLYFAHPEARYFGVGKLGRDQVADLSERSGEPLSEVERWLAPNLGYTP